MVIVKRIPRLGQLVRAASYAAVIATLACITIWAYVNHRRQPPKVYPRPPATAEVPAPAGFDRRLALANEQELVAPPAFPWSLAAISRLPAGRVDRLRILSRPPAPAESAAAAPADAALTALLEEELSWQAPALARPFALPQSPPYLVTPLTVDLELQLDERGAAAAAAVGGAPADLNAHLAEAATAFVFPAAAANVSFAATLTLIPYHYERLAAVRNGRPLSPEDYALVFRALQFNSYPLYETVAVDAPGLLEAGGATTVSFIIGRDAHPAEVNFEPALEPAAAAALAETISRMFLPRTLAGARVEFVVGG